MYILNNLNNYQVYDILVSEKATLKTIGLAFYFLHNPERFILKDELYQLDSMNVVNQSVNQLIALGIIQGEKTKRKVTKEHEFFDSEFYENIPHFTNRLRGVFDNVDGSFYYNAILSWVNKDPNKKINRKNWFQTAVRFVMNDIERLGKYRQITAKDTTDIKTKVKSIIEAYQDKIYTRERMQQRLQEILYKHPEHSDVVYRVMAEEGIQ